jgi:hypothetical protein
MQPAAGQATGWRGGRGVAGMLSTTRRVLVGLAGIAVATLVVSGLTKTEDHGVLELVSNASWVLFLCSALAIVVVGVTSLARRRS